MQEEAVIGERKWEGGWTRKKKTLPTYLYAFLVDVCCGTQNAAFDQ